MKMTTTSSFESPILTATSSESTTSASQVERLAKIEALIDKLMGTANCAPFLQPVDTKDYPDYLDEIENPMDLGTVKCKLSNSQYLTAADAYHDLSRVWDNCLIYNAKGSAIYRVASKCKRASAKVYKNLNEEGACIYAYVFIYCVCFF